MNLHSVVQIKIAPSEEASGERPEKGKRKMEKEKKIPGVCLTPEELTLLGFHDVVKDLAAGRACSIYYRPGEDHPAYVVIQERPHDRMIYTYDQILDIMHEMSSDENHDLMEEGE